MAWHGMAAGTVLRMWQMLLWHLWTAAASNRARLGGQQRPPPFHWSKIKSKV